MLRSSAEVDGSCPSELKFTSKCIHVQVQQVYGGVSALEYMEQDGGYSGALQTEEGIGQTAHKMVSLLADKCQQSGSNDFVWASYMVLLTGRDPDSRCVQLSK
jgi:hypothetical protein